MREETDEKEGEQEKGDAHEEGQGQENGDGVEDRQIYEQVMAKGRKSKTMVPYTPRKRKGGAKKKRNGMQKAVAMKDAVTKMTKRGFGR